MLLVLAMLVRCRKWLIRLDLPQLLRPMKANSGRILAGLAILEDGLDQTAELHAVLPPDIPAREPELLERHRAYFPRLPVDRLNVLVVDDNSPDGTAEKVRREYKKSVRVIVRKRERGLATAIKRGIQAARSSYIVIMDADFNHPPKYLPTMLKELANADVVIGSRFVSGPVK